MLFSWPPLTQTRAAAAPPPPGRLASPGSGRALQGLHRCAGPPPRARASLRWPARTRPPPPTRARPPRCLARQLTIQACWTAQGRPRRSRPPPTLHETNGRGASGSGHGVESGCKLGPWQRARGVQQLLTDFSQRATPVHQLASLLVGEHNPSPIPVGQPQPAEGQDLVHKVSSCRRNAQLNRRLIAIRQQEANLSLPVRHWAPASGCQSAGALARAAGLWAAVPAQQAARGGSAGLAPRRGSG